VAVKQKMNGRTTGLGLGLAIAAVFGFGGSAIAQLTPDNTLGAESSTVTPNGPLSDRINGGATRGANLFHSFQDFNVGSGRQVYFANPAGVANILTRVTGGNASDILGTLGVSGTANLFLLNPNGILFGPNSQLDIAGSFVATTADSVLFDNGFAFSAGNPQAPPLLTVSVPLGLQYGTNNTGVITNRGNLTVGENFTLGGAVVDLQGQIRSGGDLTVQGTETVRIRDSATDPFIAAAGGKLVVQGNQLVDIFALNHPDSGLFSGGEMVLRSDNAVSGDAHYWSGGSFRIEALDGSLGDLYSPYDPIILASGNVSLGNYFGNSLHILAGGSVTTGNIEINNVDATANSINPNNTNTYNGTNTYAELANANLSNGTPFETIQGDVFPTVDIRAGVDWAALGGFPVPDPTRRGTFSTTPTISNSPINSANITTGRIRTNIFIGNLTGGRVLLTNQYNPNNLPGNITVNGTIDTRDDLGGGVIGIDSRGEIALNGGINASAYDRAFGGGFPDNTFAGNGGDVTLLAQNTIATGAEILTEGLLGGNVTIATPESFTLDKDIFSRSYTTASSTQAGSVNVTTAGQFTLQNGAEISTQTLGTAQAGNITVNADTIRIQNPAGATSQTAIVANTNAQGNAGNVVLNAPTIELNRGFIFANTFGDGSNFGDAGTIIANTDRLTLENGSFFSTASQSVGRGGDIFINASTSVDLVGTNAAGLPSAFIFGGFNGGDAGELTVNTNRLSIRDGAIISGTAYGSGTSGNLTVNARDLVEVRGRGPNAPSSLVYETAGVGGGGTFNLTTQRLLIADGGNVSAQTIGAGDAGTFNVTASEIEVTGTSADGRFQSRLFFDSANSGQAGELKISTQRLFVRDGGIISAATSGSGSGGLLDIRASESIVIDGGSSTANTGLFFDSRGSGDVRGIRIQTGDLTVANRGQITVSGTGTGRAGDLEISARSIFLNQQGNLLAITESGEGGNIRLKVAKDILLRFNSNILTEARGTGNGGNITIDAGGFVLAVLSENSDVAATAIQGRGGNIFVTAQGVFGFSFPERLVRTSESDISAGSQLGIDGITEIFVVDFQPDIQLPNQPGVPSLGVGCTADRSRNNRRPFASGTLYNSGRGGEYTSPLGSLENNGVSAPWLELDESTSTGIVEAQGWVQLPDGRIFLTAQDPLAVRYKIGCQL